MEAKNNINIEWLKTKYNIKTDAELSDKLGVPLNTIRTWKQRGVPKNIQLNITQMNNTTREITENIAKIPKLSLTVSAGSGNNLESIDSFAVKGSLIIDLDTLNLKNSKNLMAIKVDGYSMVPMLLPDSWVVFDVVEDFSGDGLYILNWDNNLMVKLIQIQPDGHLEIISVNKDYKSYVVSMDTQVIFKIVGKVKKVIM
ncbi:MAG: S24 family peptidase [Campylobacteraceae bacterium]